MRQLRRSRPVRFKRGCRWKVDLSDEFIVAAEVWEGRPLAIRESLTLLFMYEYIQVIFGKMIGTSVEPR